MPAASEKYREAIGLYSTTDLTLGEISRRCGVTRKGLSAYIYRHHRDLLLRRNGVEGDPDGKLRTSTGQSPAAREKYRPAIEACDSEEHLDKNISQIAAMYHLNGTALGNQLRAHYPDIMEWREAERRRRGLADNKQRGVTQMSADTYARALRLLRDTDMTIEEAAERCGVSYAGLRQHIVFYHKDLMRLRDRRRRKGQERREPGTLSGNGRIREMSQEARAKYAPALKLLRTTSLPVSEIARDTGLNINSLRAYLRAWHSDLLAARRAKISK